MHEKIDTRLGGFISSTVTVAANLPSTARHDGDNGWKIRLCCCCGGGVSGGHGSGEAAVERWWCGCVVWRQWRWRWSCDGEWQRGLVLVVSAVVWCGDRRWMVVRGIVVAAKLVAVRR
nr:hypothetical protein [Tanacetum cinerariifolium]